VHIEVVQLLSVAVILYECMGSVEYAFVQHKAMLASIVGDKKDCLIAC
jgi:hypothetical protein